MMRKFILFVIVVLSIAVVVFNNLTQLIKEMFNPVFNPYVWSAFGLIVIGTTIYVVANRKMMRRN